MTQILAVGAHPDDVEFGCAAILIKEIRKGNRVKLLVLSRGEAAPGELLSCASRSRVKPPKDGRRD